MSVRIEPPETHDAWQTPGPAVATSAPADVATALLECMLRSRGSQQESARSDIDRAHELLEQARKEIRAAMERAERAEETGGFWGDVSSFLGGDIAAIAGVVAAVALAVATGGAGTPAILALVAGGLTVGAKAGQELGLDPRITAAMGLAGGVVGLVAGSTAGAGNAWTTVAQVATATQGVASGAAGGASIAEGHYQADAVEERADAKGAQNRQNEAWLRLDLAIGELERASREVSRTKERTSNIEWTENDGAQTIIARIGAA